MSGNKPKNCSHPQMCPGERSFDDRIKTEKLSLETPPPEKLLKK